MNGWWLTDESCLLPIISGNIRLTKNALEKQLQTNGFPVAG
jgi:hypothetical protein